MSVNGLQQNKKEAHTIVFIIDNGSNDGLGNWFWRRSGCRFCLLKWVVRINMSKNRMKLEWCMEIGEGEGE